MHFRLYDTGFASVIMGKILSGALVVALGTGSAFAQQQATSNSAGAELAQLYSQGLAEFQAGDFNKAATDLEALLAKAEFSPQLEPAFFSLGSAYFNGGDYKKAIGAFKNYQTKFPNGPHAADALFGMAQSNLQTKNYAEAASQFSSLEKEPRYRDQALFFSATASKEGGKFDQAI
ncbi:MAG: outer membrane protein assembly factor BamD, BamD/ComL family, partial [Spartobacteria bacterium]|nr:outer membrane protein assembly factor BamD, BamD/ComL family [Spartobacteria bacterium]